MPDDMLLDDRHFYVDGPEEWPFVELFRRGDTVRFSAATSGKVQGSCLVSLSDLRSEVERFLCDTAAVLESRYIGEQPILPGAFWEKRCPQFHCSMGGYGSPESWKKYL